MKKWTLLFCWITIFSSFTLPAHAYIDPGSGSMLLQILLGGFAGVAVAAKLYWRNISSFLSMALLRKENKDNKQDS